MDEVLARLEADLVNGSIRGTRVEGLEERLRNAVDGDVVGRRGDHVYDSCEQIRCSGRRWLCGVAPPLPLSAARGTVEDAGCRAVTVALLAAAELARRGTEILLFVAWFVVCRRRSFSIDTSG